MSRPRRIIVPGLPHHFTDRGNNGVRTFYNDDDYQQYLVWLAEYAGEHGLKVWAYCLMRNHIHIIGVPERAESPEEVFQALHGRHANRVNAREGLSGHLWHGRYFACVMDEPHLYAAVRYVERNPVRAGLVQVAEEYEWSSAQPHCGRRPDPVLSFDLPLVDLVPRWSEWLRAAEDEDTLARLRLNTRNGMPCGSDAFQGQVAQRLGISLDRRGRGRPRKNSG